MKTVTTYAEKKAKQFLNLLQGYTKGIRITAILILLLMGVNNVWGASVTPKGKYFYFKTSDTWKVDGARFAVCFQWKEGGGQDDAWVSCTGVPNVPDMYYVQAPDKYWDIYFCRMNGSNQTNSWSNKWNQTGKLQYDGTKNHWTKSSGWDENTTYSIYAPPMNSVTLNNNGTSIVSGSGTSGDPYLVYVGTSIKVIASGTKAVNDPDATIYYDFKQGTTSKQDGTSATYSFTASSTVNTSYTINLDGYTKISSTSSTKTPATALYFKTIEKTYTVTVNNDGHGTTSPSGAQSNVGQVTGLSIEATPAANYEFVNWTITSGSGSFGSATSASTTFKPTSAATIQANFRSTATNSLTVVAGANIEAVTGSTAPVTLGDSYPITATPKTGYTFSTWTAEPAANGTFASATSSSTNVTVKNGSVTVTASATENLSTLTTSNKYDAGNPGYAIPTKSVNSIGVTTTATINATAAEEGYTFAGWELTNCVRTDGGDETATSIIVKSNGDGEAATVVAKYNEKLNTDWVLKGSFVDDFKTAYDFVKKSGESTGTVAYVSIELAANTAYQFKVVNGSKWYGNNNSNEQHWIKQTVENWEFWDDAGNCHMKTNVADTYTFKIDYSKTAPLKVSVLYPTAYTVTYSHTPTAAADKPQTSPSIPSGELVVDGTSVTFTAQDAKTGYAWKGWYDNNSGTGEALSTDKVYTRSITANTTIYAVYTAKTSNVTLNPQPGEGGTTFVDATTGSAMPDIDIPTRHGYTFGGYYDQEAGNGTQYYNESGKSAKDWDKEGDVILYAKWTATPYTITYNTNGGNAIANGSYTIEEAFILPTPTKIGSTFEGWFDNSELTGEAITTIASGSTGNKEYWAKWNIGTYTIEFDMEGGAGGTTSVQVTHGTAMPTINTPTKDDHLFDGYYDGDGGKGTKYYNADGTSAKNWDKENATLYAKWIPYSDCIFFKNNLKWNNVYVYTFSADVWDGSKGVQPKNTRVEYGKMTQIGQTDVYCYILTNTTTSFSHIAFCDKDQNNYDYLYQANAAYRGDRSNQMPLFIPQTNQTPNTSNQTKYYNSGIWMKYNSTESGYVFANNIDAQWNEDPLVTDAAGGYHFATEVSLSGNTTYKFKIKSIKEDWFRTNTAITSTKNTDIEFKAEVGGNDVQLTTTSPGTYIISIDVTDGKMIVSVEYPLQGGDYRLVYVESEVLGQAPYTKFHPAQSIRYQAEGEKIDTISFYINQATGKNPAILLQQCSIDGATITWNDVAIQYINGNGGANPAIAQAPAKRAGELYIGTGNVSITKNGVYNFHLSQNDGVATMLEDTHPYVGNYYIRTDGADGGWRKYNTTPDNIMTHSQTALTHGGYDYYFCKWLQKGSSVKYVVANDYSYCVSDTLTTDDIVTNINGDLPANANVRFTWNSSTDSLSRAYLAGSGIISDRYLVLIGNANLKDTSGKNFNVSGLKANEVAFEDMGNWLYQLDVKANQNTLVKLTADYNKKTQYFKGSADETEQLIKGSENYYTLRLIYDFKTNYLVSGLVGNQTITDNLDLEEVMIVRSHHEEAQTLKISGNGSVTAKKAYGVMTFKKTTLNDNTKSQYARALYWVSFPFDVKLDEAFGFGNYGEHWIMEYYDGKARAKNGAWVDSDTYWKYIENPNYTLEAGKGYVLCLDLDSLGNSAEFWNNENTEIALYFPSSEENPILINNEATQRETIVPEYICTIERDDRNLHDSNWNIIGVPAYTKIAEMVGENIFYYQYNAVDNTYVSDVTPNFNTMHAYMVQFAGTINWTEQATSIAALAARKSPTSKDQYTLRLALQQEGTDHDHTFIRLQEDNATAEFDMNYDLCKIINRGANIYSMINNVEVAANVLPVEERIIPIGLDIHETGNYTFAMPDGTDGITAILIDYETGKETNLLLADYTTELREGTNNERFALRVRPNHVATEVETIIDGANGQIQKYIINGALYILNNGQLYDAQGRMVQP